MLVPLLLALLADRPEDPLGGLRELRGRLGTTPREDEGLALVPHAQVVPGPLTLHQVLSIILDRYTSKVLRQILQVALDQEGDLFTNGGDGIDEELSLTWQDLAPAEVLKRIDKTFRSGLEPLLLVFAEFLWRGAQRRALLRGADQLDSLRISYIVDWFEAVHPDVSGMTFERVLEATDAWHAALRMAAKRLRNSPVQGGVSVVWWPDGAHLDRLVTRQDFIAEGRSMGHCIGGPIEDLTGQPSGYSRYITASRDGEQASYSYRNGRGVPLLTMTLGLPAAGSEDDLAWIEQVQGPGNQALRQGLPLKRVLWFFGKVHELEDNPDEAECLADLVQTKWESAFERTLTRRSATAQDVLRFAAEGGEGAHVVPPGLGHYMPTNLFLANRGMEVVDGKVVRVGPEEEFDEEDADG